MAHLEGDIWDQVPCIILNLSKSRITENFFTSHVKKEQVYLLITLKMLNITSRTLLNALISKYSHTCSSPCNHSHIKQPALVYTTTIVKTGLNCYLNFVMTAPVSNCDHFWNYPTGFFLCF